LSLAEAFGEGALSLKIQVIRHIRIKYACKSCEGIESGEPVEHGHITPDNNAAENAIRTFVVGRKNRLFTGHPNGAHAGATLSTLIETAKACGLEPYAYLRFLFTKIPHAQTDEQYAALLPQKLAPEQLALADPYV
jgi:transposase